MAENVHRAEQYKYTANSNLVLQADWSSLPRRDQEPSGEPETLHGKINPKQFGDRAMRTVKEQREKIAKKKQKDEEKRKATGASEIDDLKIKKSKKERFMKGYGLTDVLAATEDLEGLNYRPKTKETKAAFELILAFVHEALGGEAPQDVLRGATDEVLILLKDDSKKDFDKKKEIEGLIGNVEGHKFAQLVTLGKKITDFRMDDGSGPSVDDGSGRDPVMDEENGVAVIIDEDDEDDDVDDDYVREEDDDDDDDDEEDIDTRASQILKSQQGEEVDEEMDDGEDDFNTTVVSGAKEDGSALKRGGGEEDLNPHDIDAFWLQRTISTYYPDDRLKAQGKSEAAFKILASSIAIRDCENDLMELFEFSHFDLVHLLTRNRDIVLWCTRLSRATTPEEKTAVMNEMKNAGMYSILTSLEKAPVRKNEDLGRRGVVEDAMELDDKPKSAGVKQEDKSGYVAPKVTLDLEAMAFTQGGHLMSNKKCKLPEGSFKKSKKGYEEIHVPEPKPYTPGPNDKIISIPELPNWTHLAFRGASALNPVQSKVYPAAFESDDPILVCAPTGAGKTNIAMLTMLREIGKHRNQETGEFELDSFKIVYVAPMKALVAEMVGNFGARLKEYGITVAELTGDRSLTKQQISETQIIVTTPEKWDIITRKATDRSYTNLVRLIIIDEIHLLHDDRGPVLESIVSRTIRNMEQTHESVRLVGLSATLPNFRDVATFLRIEPSNIFFFDGSYRPCPLRQTYIGITEKKAIKRLQMMNEIVYQTVLEEVKANNQLLVFCHSRKETAKTARAIKDMAMENDTIGDILSQDAGSREILREQSEDVKNADLQDLLPFGLAIHHAGMSRADRTLVEDLFAEGHVQVLVSTATLAWGVNLPAHTVVIKGTQLYSPEKGRWVELSPQDMLQMLGRAGRPKYDTNGTGVIITTHGELQYYLSLLNQQLPIESQLISKLADILNAEIVLGNIKNRDDAADWLRYTYLYIRMRRNPPLYSVTMEELEADETLLQKRIDLVHSAAMLLEKSGLLKYEKKTGKFQILELGRIASHYYISYQSMLTYKNHLKPTNTIMDLFRIFALSEEFKFIPVREEEKLELSKLLERVPIPVKEYVEEPVAKINVLLQAYISQLKLEGFALMSDMVYITQSASRILRAIFEICLKQGWAQLSRKALDLCKMVDKRMWLSMLPLRQFKMIQPEILKSLERKDISWDRYYDLTPEELGELAKLPKAGKLIHKFVHQFPKLDLVAHVQPISRSLLKIQITITPDFEFDEKSHPGGTEQFWIFIEDCDNEILLFHDVFLLKQQYATEEHVLSFTVPVFEPLQPNYFVSVVSDRWLSCETRLPISFKHLILPAKYPPHTELLDLQPLPVAALQNESYAKIYTSDGIKTFNSIQTQTFNSLFHSNDNVFIGASCGSGKTVCAEFALLRLWNNDPEAKCVYIAPFSQVVDLKVMEWQKKFGGLLGGKNIVVLTGESTADLKLLERGDIIFSTPQQWDVMSRRWKQRAVVQSVGLFIVDDIHLIGGELGPTLEVIVSRMRIMNAESESKNRIIALGVSLANAKDLGDWIGAAKDGFSLFNFSPSVRNVPLEILIQGYNIPHFASLMLAMMKPAYTALKQSSNSIVFVSSPKQSRLTAIEFMTTSQIESPNEKLFLNCDDSVVWPIIEQIQDKTLGETLLYGIGYFHDALSKGDKLSVRQLFSSGAIKVLVASKETCWGLGLRSDLVILMGTLYYEGKEHRYADYQMTDVLQMVGCATNPSSADANPKKCIIMCPTSKKEFYKKFLDEALPVESHLDQLLHDHFNAEIVSGIIENKQDAVDYLTWTFLYRRLLLNPNYYNLTGNTPRHLSDYLSDLVERTIDDLSSAKCISVEEDDVSPLNLGMISAYYYISYQTIELFSLSLEEKTKIRGLLEILVAAAEFELVPIRHHEDSILKKIYDRLPIKLSTGVNYNDPHFKAHILLQCHFSRIQLPPDLESDQKVVLKKVIPLIQSCVDVISTSGWLSPALSAMELSQMTVQALWDRDSVLRQIPHFGNNEVEFAKKHYNVESIFDFSEMEDEMRNEFLGKIMEGDGRGQTKIKEIAKFVNSYPNVDFGFELVGVDDEVDGVKVVPKGVPVIVRVVLERDSDEDQAIAVYAPFFPAVKDEGWWVVIGDPQSKTLLGIKRTTLMKRQQLKLDFTVPESAKTGQKLDLKIYLMCDCYLGVDQEFDIEVIVGDAVEEDEDEEMED
ncbi:DEIH-box ATPase [Nowakowskiella sp. JEL0407]|nr:DEIH-box ATPase [Nowakowskiella sp. JEL0407]